MNAKTKLFVKKLDEIVKEELNSIIEKSPKGWEGTVKALKKHGDKVDNPWALAHWMKKKGYKSHESVNEAIKVRNGETAMEGKWGVYDNSTGKAIKEVGNVRAATRLMNRLMSSGQYKEVAAKWVGEPVSEVNIKDIGQILKKRQAKKIDGVLVDMQTANVIMKVHKALNASNRKKFEKLSITKMADVAWKLVK